MNAPVEPPKRTRRTKGGLTLVDVARVAGVAPRRIAVGVGSRGIAGIGRIVGAVVDTLRQLGFDPFVVPAMGSHGAATAEGQAELLAGYGIDRSLIRATMETEVVASRNVVQLLAQDMCASGVGTMGARANWP